MSTYNSVQSPWCRAHQAGEELHGRLAELARDQTSQTIENPADRVGIDIEMIKSMARKLMTERRRIGAWSYEDAFQNLPNLANHRGSRSSHRNATLLECGLAKKLAPALSEFYDKYEREKHSQPSSPHDDHESPFKFTCGGGSALLGAAR